jgi:hypothetical protein
VSALVGEQVDGCEANLLSAASGASTSELQRASRQWSDEEWEAAVGRLRGRGWVDDDTALTPAGLAAKRRIEDRTDDLATPPLAALDESEHERLVALFDQVSRAIVDAGGVTFPNPIGLPDPRKSADS